MSGVRPERTTCQSSPSWLVSFGDLLTLLLCMFIAILSTSEPRIRNNIDKDQGIRAAAPILFSQRNETVNVQNSGTLFAHPKNEGVIFVPPPAKHDTPAGVRLALKGADFQNGEFEKAGPFAKFWEDTIVPEITLVSSLELTLCGEREAVSQELAVSLIKFLTHHAELPRVSIVIHEFDCEQVSGSKVAEIGFVDIS